MLNPPLHEDYKEPVTRLPTIYSLAREALEDCGNDSNAAADLLYNNLSTDAKLLRAVARASVLASVKSTVNLVIRTDRRGIFQAATQEDRDRDRAGVSALAEVISESLLDMPLASGTRLRDAMRGEIIESAERYGKLAATTGHRARWLHMVAKAVPDGKRCGDVMSDEEALELYTKAAGKGIGEASHVAKPNILAPRQDASRGRLANEHRPTIAAGRVSKKART